MPYKIVFDADMVLIDYMAQLVRYVEEVRGHRALMSYKFDPSYDLAYTFPSLKPAEMQEIIRELSVAEDYYSDIPLMKGAKDGIARIREELPDTPVVCVTSGGNHPLTREMRLKNLAPFELDEIITLPLNGSKVATLLELQEPGGQCILFDDSIGHVRAAAENGQVGVLYSQPYNTDEDVLHRVKDWNEIVQWCTTNLPQLSQRSSRLTA
ncbi:hypothetical protein TH5_01835 [Thalassospira xianhensis MCCC 1A02616]|uniref:HAD family hydrolase n=2 Tax=Thalassospira xianhensis TaxID=478503 RepID=A0A367UHX1_9PROT|nr:hypothetical protein [Thalassospira xianhensis]RCK07808.1 hypothetical protein TH5_01835 [Thalassospira xianhensis MCCC 1A02616]